MSVCTPCLQVKPVPVCTNQLNIGTISEVNTAIAVYVEDITTRQLLKFQATSGAAGEVEIDLEENRFFDNHSYVIFVTKADEPMTANQMITIGTDQSEWICARFKEVRASDGSPEVFAEVTLEV